MKHPRSTECRNSLPALGWSTQNLGNAQAEWLSPRRLPQTEIHFKEPFSRAGPANLTQQKETLSSQIRVLKRLRPHYLNISLACQIPFQPVLLSPTAWDPSKLKYACPDTKNAKIMQHAHRSDVSGRPGGGTKPERLKSRPPSHSPSQVTSTLAGTDMASATLCQLLLCPGAQSATWQK